MNEFYALNRLCAGNLSLLVFDEDMRGKRIYFAVRWKSDTVKKGTWSEIFSAFVP